MRKIFITCILLLFCCHLVSYGEDNYLKTVLVKKSTELKRVKKKIREKRQKTKSFVRRESSLTSELSSIQMSLSKRNAELESVNSQVEDLNKKIKYNNDIISKTGEDSNALKSGLSRRLVAIYKFGKSGYNKDALRCYRFMNVILNHDLALADRYRHDMLTLKEKEKGLKEDGRKLVILKASKERSKAGIQAKIQRKNRTLTSIKRGKSSCVDTARDLERDYKRLQSMIEGLDRKIKSGIKEKRLGHMRHGFATQMGKLDIPVSGKILPLYGKQQDPALHTFTLYKGIDILAPTGSKIKAVYDGKVLFSDWFKGYGKIIIIDHGNAYCTIFAHASKLLKKASDAVKQGEVIALVGDTDSIKGPHLYFEIRHQGKPQNPMDWLAISDVR